MARYVQRFDDTVDTPEVDAFLAEVHAVCMHHRMYLRVGPAGVLQVVRPTEQDGVALSRAPDMRSHGDFLYGTSSPRTRTGA